MKNRYKLEGDTLIIYLNKSDGTYVKTKVSSRHLETLNKINTTWCVIDQKVNTRYVMATIREKGKQKTLRLHRIITNAPKDLVVNHINGNGLDNTDENLEVVTSQVNTIKRAYMNSNNTSGVRGVSWDKSRNKWQVKFRKDYKTIHFGRYENLIEAEKVAEKAFKDLYNL